MLSKHLTHLPTCCLFVREVTSPLHPWEPCKGEAHPMPPTMPSICSSWAEEVPILEEGKDWEDLPTDYFIFFLIESVIKEVVRGGEETLKSQNSY